MLTRKLYTFSFFSIFKEKGGNPKNVGKVASLDLFVNNYVAKSVSEVQPPSPATAQCVPSETLYHRDDALLYMAYVMLIWAAPIPADRWHCSLWP